MKDLIGLKIKKFTLNEYNKVTIELSNGSTYSANLSSFSDVYCYPKNSQEWKKASVGENSADIEWESGFAVHLDQIATLANQQKAS